MKYILIILILFSCAGTKTRDSTGSKTIVAQHPACCDSVIELNKNDTLILQFIEHPARAYTWLLTNKSKTEDLIQIDEKHKTKSDLDDSEELVEYIFLARNCGSVELKYEFRRPWEKSKPAADICNVKIKIR